MLTRIKKYTFNLGAIAITLGATAIGASPSLAQVSVPITSGTFSVNLTNAGAVTSTPNGITVLTPVGTAQITSLTGTTATSTPLSANGAFNIQGTATNGSVNFDDGRTATFTNAQSTIKGSINKVDNAVPVGNSPVSALTAPVTVTGSINTGSSIQVPTSSISALPANTVVIPITGGTFDVIRSASTTTTNTKTTILTPYGSAQLSDFKYNTFDNLNGKEAFAIDDQVRATGLASGSIPNKVSTFTDAKTAFVGTVKTATLNSNASNTLKGDITSGTLVVPASATTLIPAISSESIIIFVTNPQLVKLIGLSPSILAPGRTKLVRALADDQKLLSYVESKSSEIESGDATSLGSNNAVDKFVFFNFRKKELFYFSEVSFRQLLAALSTSTTTTTTSTTTASTTGTTGTGTTTSTSSTPSTSTTTASTTGTTGTGTTGTGTTTSSTTPSTDTTTTASITGTTGTGTTTSSTSSTPSTSTTTAATQNQVVRVVFIGIPSRLIAGFGLTPKLVRVDR